MKGSDVLKDDLRGMWFVMLKDLRAYYFKPPNVSWGILFPFSFVLAFVIRGGGAGDLSGLVPGLLALTLMFGTTSMEAIVITFERRVGALERLLLAPLRLPALLAGKLLGGMAFGLVTTAVVLVVALLVFGASGIYWPLLIGATLLSGAAFSALGALISVSVKEVFEAQTLANAFRFPMIFLSGIFVPVVSLPPWLRVVASALPLTYAVRAMRAAMGGGNVARASLDLVVLVAFTLTFFVLAAWTLARRVA
jgi:ABC-2 type transport system permease protein